MVGEAVRLKYRCLLAKKSKKEAFTVGERDWRKKGKSGATQTHNKALMSRLVRAPSSRACERRARAEGRGVVAAPRFMEKALWGWWSLDVRGKIPQSFSLPLSLSVSWMYVQGRQDAFGIPMTFFLGSLSWHRSWLTLRRKMMTMKKKKIPTFVLEIFFETFCSLLSCSALFVLSTKL